MPLWKDTLDNIKQNCNTLKDLFFIAQEAFPNGVFSIEESDGRTVKTLFCDMAGEARCIANRILDMNLSPSSYIGIAMENCHQWVSTFWGILMAGHIPFFVNITFTREQVVRIFSELGVTLCVHNGDYLYDGIDGLNCLDAIRFGDDTAREYLWEDYFVLTTSGSSGRSKIYRYSGHSICVQIECSRKIIADNPSILINKDYDIRLLALLPFYHIFGFITLVAWFGVLARTLVFPNSQSADDISSACRKYRVTHLFAVPMVWNLVEQKIKNRAKELNKLKLLERGMALSLQIQKTFYRGGAKLARKILKKQVLDEVFGTDLAFCISGGAPINSNTLLFINSLGYPLYNGYGLTEAGIVSVETSLNINNRLYTFCGKPLTEIDVKINEDGILCLKGDTLFDAKWDGATFVKRDREAWYATNDFASIEMDRLCIHGRQDDVIITANGENVFPDEIEQLLYSNGIDNVCVFADKNKDKNDIVYACCCPVSERKTFHKKLLNAINVLPNQYRPSKIAYSSTAFPTVKSCVNRVQVSEKYFRGEFQFFDENDTSVNSASVAVEIVEVMRIFANVLNRPIGEVYPESDFFLDLGGNSLQFFEVIHAIVERYDIEFGYGSSDWLPNPQSISEYIQNKKTL